ncbi:MAG: hypothetical protein Q4D62_14555, partial [Planctomycetia bacterium]|nr:hypothetical protein [Planctomycetia bacterium]
MNINVRRFSGKPVFILSVLLQFRCLERTQNKREQALESENFDSAFRNFSKGESKLSRGGRARTLNLRFWRPLLC